MPEPRHGEEHDDFISRCIPVVLDDGTASDQDQAVAVCNSLWETAKKGSVNTLPQEVEKDGVIVVAVKAIGDWELDVLAIPYGGPNRGKDAQDEYFNPTSDLHLDIIPNPIVAYFHGFDPDGKPQKDPEIIGKTLSHERRSDGVWFRIALDKTSKYAKRIWEAAKDGLAKASSGSVAHLVRTAKDGLITNWPLYEITLVDENWRRRAVNSYAVALPVMKASYQRAGLDLPDLPETNGAETEDIDGRTVDPQVDPERELVDKTLPVKGEFEMEKEELLKVLEERDALKEAKEKEAVEAADKEKQAEQELIAAALKTAKEEWEKEAAENNRLPSDKEAPYVTKYGELSKYDNLDPTDQAFMCGILDEAYKSRINNQPVSEFALKALVIKMSKDQDKTEASNLGIKALVGAGFKANMKTDEVMQQSLTSFGEEWVGVAYSTALWEAIRTGTFVANMLPDVEVPQGMESIYLPIESTDPVYYHVAEAADHDSTMLFPVATVKSSQVTTGRVQLVLNKMGCRVPWSGEMEEDSLIPFVAQLRAQITTAGAEQLEHLIIDGDDASTATTNINDIGNGSTQTITNLYTLFDGFRVSPLVTTAANSRDGGVLTVFDFLETIKLMGTAGINAIDKSKVGFILDVNTHWKALELAEVLTKDVFAQPTIENGNLTGIFGYKVFQSAFMHYKSAARKANSDGKVDQDTTTNNTKGAILAVRWDQWRLGWRRRMTLETTRYPRSDSSEIVALMRLGLIQRDTEAAAISYNLTI